MKNYYKKALELYVDYKKELVSAHNIYDLAKKSGNYSQKKLDEFFTASQEAVGNADGSFSRRLSQLESDYISELKETYFFGSKSNALKLKQDNLMEMLQTNLIDFTPDEYETMAKKYADNLPLSRVLHDYAARHGYNLRNYVSLTDKLNSFDKLKGILSRLANSSLTESDRNFQELAVFPESLTKESNFEELSKIFSDDLPTIDYKCLKFGDIAAEMAADQAAAEAKQTYDGDAFLKGLGVEPEPKAVTDVKRLVDDIALLSAEEKEAAEQYALNHGIVGDEGAPIITREAIAWVKSDDYKKFKEATANIEPVEV
ncbi:MAG: hypothetical protein K6E51_14700 [Treponema sp.]|nr:hypothetical protein [Treponema sp.]